MVMHSDKIFRNKVADLWANGHPLEAGKLIFEALPESSRPGWAARAFKLVWKKGGRESPIFNQLLTVADHQEMWASGHQLFSTLRDSTLKLEDLKSYRALTKDEELLASVLSLAELVAKVIYNATNPADEFDEDSGWWIAAYLRAFVDNVWPDVVFEGAAWSALIGVE